MPESGRVTSTEAPMAPGVVLGFDFGSKRIGLAIGQRVTRTAAPLCTIRLRNSGEPWKTISEVVAVWRPFLFIVGIAHHPDGGENPIAGQTQGFCRHLERRYGLPVVMVDETLTTAESRWRYFSDHRRKRVPFSELKDEWAAQVILQTWLDEQHA